MSRSPLCLAIAVTGALGAGCSTEEDCGSGGAPAGDLEVAATGLSLRYQDLRARPNNDCPDPAAPAGVISLTLSGTTAGNDQAFVTFCVPRPDLLEGSRALGTEVQVVDVFGSDSTCSYRQLRGSVPSGTVTASGVCSAGRDPAGFALDFAGEVSIERTCGANKDTLRATLTGKIAVMPSSL